MKLVSVACPLALFIVLAGCSKSESPQTPVARLDGRTLTLEEVRAGLDSARGVSSAQLHEYIRRWINNEILYREAVRRGLHEKPSVLSKLDEVHRQLAIQALLEEEVYRSTGLESSEEEVAAYYRGHAEEFVLKSDLALVSFVLFRDRDAANSFRTSVLRGVSWSQALGVALADPQVSPYVAAHVDSVYYTPGTLFPAELWRVAAAAARAEPSFPIRTGDGFYILIVWKFSRQGQVADLPYVEHEIRGRLTMERRHRLLDSLMENLRARHNVEILVASTPEDTAGWKPTE